jgi:WD40 repeat protein
LSDVRRTSSPGDLVVAYCTSHGVSDVERFYLLTRESDLSELEQTATAAEDLARLLVKNSSASQIMLILDTCFAGAAAAESGSLAHRLASIVGRGPEIYIVAAARSKEEALQEALALALAKTLANEDERLGGCTQAFLALDEVMEAVNTHLSVRDSAQTATLSTANVRGRCRLLPNPRHLSALRPGLDLETQRAFAEHWVPKARGAELGASGWYFTGREHALRELAGWLRQERSGGAARVVTGGPGCGKSSVLARLVTLADPGYRKDVLSAASPETLDPLTLPPEGVVNVAVHARRKVLADVTVQIAAGLGVSARDPVSLLEALRDRKAVIIVDALDEADENEQIVSRLLAPLAVLPNIFLIIGTRPDSSALGRRYRALGENPVEINLDDPQYVGKDDVARFVERRLLAAEEPARRTPYRDAPDVARLVAGAVAQRAQGVFLVAHTAVQSLLASAGIVDVTQAGWAERLPTGLAEAFDLFLSGLESGRGQGLSAPKARAVLLPLAFAEGEGLPWVDMWANVASALSGVPVTDNDVSLVRKHAAAFIVEASEQERSVYRLYHEKLAEHLRDSVPDAKRCQQNIFHALSARVPQARAPERADWKRAHPYTLMHVAAHALKAGTLADLVSDGAFMAGSDPVRLLVALSRSEHVLCRRAFACYALAFDRLRELPHGERLAYLELTARQEGDDELAEMWIRDAEDRPWRAPWARCWPVTPHRSIPVLHSVESLSLGIFRGRPIVITGGADRAVRAWDLNSGGQLGEPLRGHTAPVTAVAFGTLEGRPIVVSGDQTVRVWDFASGTRRGTVMRGHRTSVSRLALGTFEGRPAVVSGAINGNVQVWDLTSGRPRGFPYSALAWVYLVSLISRSSREGIVSVEREAVPDPDDTAPPDPTRRPKKVGLDGVLLPEEPYSAPPTQAAKQRIFYRPEDPPDLRYGWDALAIGTLDGQDVLVAGSDDGGVKIWDRATWRQQGLTMRGHEERVSAVAIGTFEGRSIVVSGAWDQTVRVWDARTGTQLGEPLRGHEGRITSLALTVLEGRAAIVSAGHDRMVRVWDLAASIADGRGAKSTRSAVTSVALSGEPGQQVIVAGMWDQTVRVWTAAAGEPRLGPVGGHKLPVTAVATGMLGERPLCASADYGGNIRMWDLATGEPHGVPLSLLMRSAVTALALGTFGDLPVLAAGSSDKAVRVWSLEQGSELIIQRRPLGRVLALALTQIDGATVAITGGDDAAVQIWELHPGTHCHATLAGHHRPVNSVAVGMLQGRRVIASASTDRTVRLWDLESLQPIGAPLTGHTERVSTVAVGLLGGREVIASGSGDKSVRIWDSEGAPIATIRTGSDVWSLAFAAAGQLVVAASRGLMLLQLTDLNSVARFNSPQLHEQDMK